MLVRPFQFDVGLVGAAVALVAIATGACDRAALLAPTNSSIQLTAGSLVVPAGGTTQLTVVVLENSGQPVPNGTTVRFTTTLGTVDPVEAQTRNGVANAMFVAGSESGTAQVRAISGLASGGTTSSGGTGTGTGSTPSTPTTTNQQGSSVSIAVGAAAVGGITLSANPSTVRSSGSSVEISALVNSTNGSPLPNVQVAFGASRGTITPSLATTDAGGVARTTLTASETTTVTASVGGAAPPTTTPGGTPTPPIGQRSATLEVRQSSVAAFTLATTPATPAANQPVNLTITPVVPSGNTTGVPSSTVTVEWGDGNTQNIGVVSAVRSVVHTYTAPGFYTISAIGTTSDGEVFTNSIPVTVAQQPPVAVRAEPTSGNLATNFAFTITPTTGALIERITIQFDSEGTQDLGAIGTETTVTRRFNTTGQKTVTVEQREINGRVTRATVQVTVTP